MDQMLVELGKSGPAWLLLALILLTLYQGFRGAAGLIVTKGFPYLFDEKTGKLTGLINYHAETLIEGKKMMETVTQCSLDNRQGMKELKEVVSVTLSEQNPIIRSLIADVEKVCDLAMQCPRVDASEICVLMVEMLCDIEEKLSLPSELQVAHRTRLATLKQLITTAKIKSTT